MRLLNNLVIALLRITPKPVLFLFARRYISGSKLSDAVRVVKELNSKGISATIDLLGEEVKNEGETRKVLEEYKRVVDAIVAEGLDSGISIKPTHYGLRISKELCYRNIREIVSYARQKGVFVCIDMEDSTTTDDTLEIYERLREEGFENVGFVLQAMLRRTLKDAQRLGKWKPVVRICKGIYKEPYEIAYHDDWVIHRNFGLVAEEIVKQGGYPAFATHNDRMIWEALRVIHQYGLKPDQYEFQMLYGVRERLRDILVKEGHRVRIYVPYGEDWKPYTIRRFRENPDMLGYVIKALFTGKRT